MVTHAPLGSLNQLGEQLGGQVKRTGHSQAVTQAGHTVSPWASCVQTGQLTPEGSGVHSGLTPLCWRLLAAVGVRVLPILLGYHKYPGESGANICNNVEVFRLFKRKEGIKGKTLTNPSPTPEISEKPGVIWAEKFISSYIHSFFFLKILLKFLHCFLLTVAFFWGIVSRNVSLCFFLGIHPAFFVLLCTALVSVMLVLVLYTTFRSNTQQKDLVEVFSCSYFELG